MVDVHGSRARPYSLAAACVGAFTERTRRRGRALVEQGEVAIEGATVETVLVFVRGDRPKPYVTAVDFSEVETRERVRVECSCPYFRDGYPCEHIYASLLAIEASDLGLVDGDHWPSRLDVVPYQAGIPADDDWFFEGDDAFAKRHELAEAFFEGRGRGREPDWRGRLQSLRRGIIDRRPTLESALERRPIDRLEFHIQRDKSEDRGSLLVAVARRDPDPDHPGGKLTPLSPTEADVDRLTRSEDRKALTYLLAHPLAGALIRSSDLARTSLSAYVARIPRAHWDTVLPSLVETGSFRCPLDDEGLRTTPPIHLDDGPPWRFHVRLTPGPTWTMAGELVRPDAVVSVEEATLVIRDGLALFHDRLARLDVGDEYDWLKLLRREGPIEFPPERAEEVFRELATIGNLPPFLLSDSPWRTVEADLVPAVDFRRPDPRSRFVVGEIAFHYGNVRFDLTDPRWAQVDGASQTMTIRRPSDEATHLEVLGRLGAQTDEALEEGQVGVRPGDLQGIVRRLVQRGFTVRAEDRLVRGLTARSFRVRSGVDWFDVDGELDFEGVKVKLPDVLRALKKSDGVIDLGDGSEGVLPEEWLRRIEALGRIGQQKDGQVRFGRSQALLLDVLLDAADAELDLDPTFVTTRSHLSGATRLAPTDEPAGFDGELRTYQKQGLAWLTFLDRAGLGGCLADDMGLGKTVQVLAMLQQLYSQGGDRAPSLVVAPRSLVYNWLREAERFTPDLRVVDYTGVQRADRATDMDQADIVVTTYGTVRRDILELRERSFDHVILDEAQAIKNPSAQSSKACRLLVGRRKLALSGTPVENDASELWSIFEFLNPRMLGSQREFQSLVRSDASSISLVAKGLRPLLLRRTKSQVLSELPEKTELTIHCELSPPERQAYEELREHYRQSVMDQVDKQGLARSRMHVLEALLRLRQAACHLGLIDEAHASATSSKIDALYDHLEEVLAEGHKALVFSQFVKLLGFVRKRLDAEGVPYAYLDGQTTDREKQVRDFMEGDDRRVFLISLKAGGLGLNLTAADYVFILDPWWNPAIEAQAIDRAHRIGQTRPVFAYRFVAQETVEEKIIELHARKRKLADALVQADDAQTADVSLDDLRMLLDA